MASLCNGKVSRKHLIRQTLDSTLDECYNLASAKHIHTGRLVRTAGTTYHFLKFQTYNIIFH